MTFESPTALWGLASLLLLAVFSLWRQAAVRAVVPSLLLWKLIPERNPPLRALRRPAWRWELLLQALAIAFLVAGLAGPALLSDAPRPRRVALVVDTSARLAAGGRLDRLRARAAELLAGEFRDDAVVLLAGDPAPRTLRDPGEIAPYGGHVDLAPLIAVARAQADLVLVLGDRAPDGVRAELLAGPAANVGIVEFTAGDAEVFARLVNHGPPRRVALVLDGAREEIDLPAGERAWSRKADFSARERIDLEIDVDDGFDADDRAGAVRLGSPRAEVSLRGLPVPLLDRALTSIPGVVLRADAARPALAVGVDEDPGPGGVRVKLLTPNPRSEPLSMTRPEPRHPLLRGLRDEELRSSGTGALEPGGTPLLTADGRAVMAKRGDVLEVSISFEPGRWPSTPSWPIFWANVVDSARRGAGTLVVPRVGTPLATPSGEPATPSAAGEFKAGGKSMIAGLLDARESDAAGVSRPPEAPGAASAARERRRSPLGGGAALLALACAAAAWVLQKRGNG
jgi:hypothetical protein